MGVGNSNVSTESKFCWRSPPPSEAQNLGAPHCKKLYPGEPIPRGFKIITIPQLFPGPSNIKRGTLVGKFLGTPYIVLKKIPQKVLTCWVFWLPNGALWKTKVSPSEKITPNQKSV